VDFKHFRGSDIEDTKSVVPLLLVLNTKNASKPLLAALYDQCDSTLRTRIAPYVDIQAKRRGKTWLEVKRDIATLLNNVKDSSGSLFTREQVESEFPHAVRAWQSTTDEYPALRTITTTTLPLLTTVLFGFTATLLGTLLETASQSERPKLTITILDPATFTAESAAYLLLTTSAFLFLAATLACIRSQAWNYFALSADQRAVAQLSTDPAYIDRCYVLELRYHAWAVHSYHWGLLALLLGIAAALAPVSKGSATIAILAALMSVIADWFARKSEARVP
jgi:hypothetical protein